MGKLGLGADCQMELKAACAMELGVGCVRKLGCDFGMSRATCIIEWKRGIGNCLWAGKLGLEANRQMELQAACGVGLEAGCGKKLEVDCGMSGQPASVSDIGTCLVQLHH